MNKEGGVTLVEITIVMVIIGLIIGTILKGQEIIINAKIKSIEKNYNEIMTAVYNYNDRYRVLPGDDPLASTKFGQAIQDGNGNGKIEGYFNSMNETDESRLVWSHLRSADLIMGEKSSVELPYHTLGGVMGLSSQRLDREVPTITGLFEGFTNIPNNIAIILDLRYDDNDPIQGYIQTDAIDKYNKPSTLHNIYFTL